MDATTRSRAAVLCCPGLAQEPPALTRPLSFSPAGLWLAHALQSAGIRRFLLLSQPQWFPLLRACFPPEACCAGLEDAAALAAFAGAETGPVLVLRRPIWLSQSAAAGAVSPQAPTGGSTGCCRISPQALARDGLRALDGAEELALPPGGFLLLEQPSGFCLGQELARKEAAGRLMAAGVYITDPAAVYIDPAVRVGAGTVLHPGTVLRGSTVIGAGCVIGPQAMLTNCTVGDKTAVNASQCEESCIGSGCEIGPYAHLRPGCTVGDESKIGAFVQLKNCSLGRETKMAHLTYVGDSDVGDQCNFGCGTVTCNYDGQEKHRTVIGSRVFLGCNTNLVAPVTVEDGAYTAAGTTVTRTVPAGALAIGRVRQEVKEGWADRRRQKDADSRSPRETGPENQEGD